MAGIYARQAIETRYHGATDTKGSRVSATAEAGRVYSDWDDSKNPVENHEAACRKLCAKLGWDGRFACGGTRNGYVWVQVEDDTAIDIASK